MAPNGGGRGGGGAGRGGGGNYGGGSNRELDVLRAKERKRKDRKEKRKKKKEERKFLERIASVTGNRKKYAKRRLGDSDSSSDSSSSDDSSTDSSSSSDRKRRHGKRNSKAVRKAERKIAKLSKTVKQEIRGMTEAFREGSVQRDAAGGSGQAGILKTPKPMPVATGSEQTNGFDPQALGRILEESVRKGFDRATGTAVPRNLTFDEQGGAGDARRGGNGGGDEDEALSPAAAVVARRASRGRGPAVEGRPERRRIYTVDIGESDPVLVEKDEKFMQSFAQQEKLYGTLTGEKILKQQLGVAGIEYKRGAHFNKQLALLNLTEWMLGQPVTDYVTAALVPDPTA